MQNTVPPWDHKYKESWNEINRILIRRIHSAALQVCSVTRISPCKLFLTATGTLVKSHVSIPATWLFRTGKANVSKAAFQTVTVGEKYPAVHYPSSDQSEEFHKSLPLKFQTVLKIQRFNTQTNYLKGNKLLHISCLYPLRYSLNFQISICNYPIIRTIFRPAIKHCQTLRAQYFYPKTAGIFYKHSPEMEDWAF